MKRYEFVEKIVYLVREKLENNLPNEGSQNEMIIKAKKLLEKILKENEKLS
jgi:hypothetical protein